MPLRYSLYKLAIHKDNNAYKARIVNRGVADEEMVYDYMVAHGSTVGKADIRGTFEVFMASLVSLLEMGFRVHLPFADFRPEVLGVFQGADDEYDPRRHTVHVSITPGARLRRAFGRNLHLHKDQQGPKTPNVDDYIDLDSGEQNRLLTPGGVGRIMGSRLKFDPADPEQGIFVVDEENHATRVTALILVKQRQLIFEVPQLPAGRYRLEVRSIIYKSPTVRIGGLDGLIVP